MPLTATNVCSGRDNLNWCFTLFHITLLPWLHVNLLVLDDLSEKALKEIWVFHRKSSAPQTQSEGKEESEEQKAESGEQEGESDEQKEESEEQKAGSEEQKAGSEEQKEESGEQEGESEEQKEESEEQKEESLPDQSKGSEEVEQPPADPMSKEQDATPPPVEVQKEASPDPYDQFDKDPFVEAAAMFRAQNYLGIIEKLTEAVEGGKYGVRCEDLRVAFYKHSLHLSSSPLLPSSHHSPFTGCPLFVSHALLLRGTMYTLWRQPEAALKDFTQMINTEGVSTEVCGVWGCCEADVVWFEVVLCLGCCGDVGCEVVVRLCYL